MDILQVAKRAGVSTATVSRVINGLPRVSQRTVARVRKAIEETNYIPNPNARSLRVGRTRLFGLIVSDVNNPFFPELIDAFEALAAAHDIGVIFTHTNYELERLDSCIRRMIEQKVDAIAIMTSEMNEQSLRAVVKLGIPIVLMNQRQLAERYPNVLVEYSTGYREALDHLLFLGHRDFGFIAGPPQLSSAQGRKRAFDTALRAHGLHVRPEWVVAGDMRVQGGRAAMLELLKRTPRPTAVLAANDLMAVGALQAAHEAGVLVPEEVSIIGFDDLPVASMVYPPLSTIRHPRRELAARAFALLQHALQEGKALPEVMLHPHLVVRESTAAPSRRRRR
ncbi:MAG: LacI family DNA-binding transcriptional regulator [Acidobacteriota bacterium]